ncbi:MAG: hypothetical protein KDJ96_06535, partial [Rhodobacteraceae bacterium]|nr:hypothetical protein [Paracoccaceae bacterium]
GPVIEKFVGDHEQSIDGKGRVSIPTKLRRVVEARDPDWTSGERPQLMVVFGARSWARLECYPIDQYKKIIDGIEDMPWGSEDRIIAEAVFFSRVFPAEILDDGRLQVPLEHRERLGLKDKVRVIGVGDYFKIVKADEPSEMAPEDDLDALIEAKGRGHALQLIPDVSKKKSSE